MVCRLPLACLQSEHSKATANGCQPSHDSVGKSNQLNQNTQTTLQYLSPSPSGSTQKVSFPHMVDVWFSEEFSTFHCSAPHNGAYNKGGIKKAVQQYFLWQLNDNAMAPFSELRRQVWLEPKS